MLRLVKAGMQVGEVVGVDAEMPAVVALMVVALVAVVC